MWVEDWKDLRVEGGAPVMIMYVCAQSCLTLHDPMDCSLAGASVHGIFQARILEWVAISSSGDPPDLGIGPAFPVYLLHSR